jgi:transposase
MWDFFGGTSLYYCTDNMKSVVITPGPEPVLNREFSDLARHYQVVVIPTRVRHPQDKGKVEVGVQVVQRWIIMRLRRRHFNSVAEINIAVMELLTWLNQRPFRHLPGCRRSRFEEYDQPVLRPLPAVPYEYGEWEGEQKVGPDYHPRVRGHYYSVHYSLVAERVEARVSAKSVEIFHRGKRIASHLRSDVVGGQTTNPEHRPIAHRAYAERTPEKFLEWAKSLGPATSAAVEYQLQSRDNSPLALRACGTLQRLAKEYGAQRLEAACQRGQEIRSLTLKSISSILRRKLDAVPTELPEQISLPLHGNVRGPHYFT